MYPATVTTTKNGTAQEVVLTDGPAKGRPYKVSYADGQSSQRFAVKTGDKIYVSMTQDARGDDIVYIADFHRTGVLITLAILFVLVVVAISRMKGIRSLGALIFSFIILSRFILPQILAGNNPVIIALLGSLLIIPATFYISHGFSRKTNIALIGTFLTLCITGLLSHIFVTAGKLTGFASEEALFLQAQGAPVDTQSALLAGIIIAAMGILDDVTISQSAVVEKLYLANKHIHFKHLYSTAMDIGRDHISSLVNTLVLVYAGASLPLFLLFYTSPLPFSIVTNQELIATEIIRTLVSSIGIILAVPVTTFIAAYLFKRIK